MVYFQAKTPYAFELELRPQESTIKFKLWERRTLIFQTPSSGMADVGGLRGGRLGLYSQSQENTYWTNLLPECLDRNGPPTSEGWCYKVIVIAYPKAILRAKYKAGFNTLFTRLRLTVVSA